MTMLPQTEINLSALERVTLNTPAAQAVAGFADKHGAQRVFLLVSTSLQRNTDEIETIAAALGARHAATHSGLRPHVPKSDLLAALQAAAGVDADMIVTIGGGSQTDAGKVVALALAHGVQNLEDLEKLRIQTGPQGRIPSPAAARPVVPVICVPTTLSAGEFNPNSGVTDETLGQKHGFGNRQTTPAGVVLDPALTRHTPEWVWLSTGVRAVDHAVETLASLRSNPYADGLADAGLRLLARGLPGCKADPADMQARLDCQIGAWLAITPLVGGVPMGASHAIGHALGSYCKVSHGHTSCVMAPYVQRWNAQAGDHGQARISDCLGRSGTPADQALDALISGLGMPRHLSDVGVTRDQLDKVADYAFQDAWGRTNPRPVTSPDDMMQILLSAM